MRLYLQSMDRAPLVTLEEAKMQVATWQKEGKVVAACSGSFDLLHAGHVRFLEEAKLQGDVLVVLLNSDVSIQGYKGPSRPIIPEQNRATLLTALRAVDLVMLFDDLTPLAILDELRPNVLVNGGDYGLDCIERPIVEAYGGRIYIVERTTASEATSAIIAKIRATE
jgi:rfaE bifunctional protein nucleotidyltransferase chain/domain